MSDFSVEFRMPKGCPNCGNHMMKVSQAKQSDDGVFCTSCNTEVCAWDQAERILDETPRSESEQLIEDVINNKKPDSDDE
ncbi:hypothetical protein EVC62_00510 [Salinicola endophyticus]|uniref:YheV family metal-binding protein n=1 Tax=Salinicola endophyticus TaxID=1949083 RepID=A0ABY8FEW8_9GAMM|nr:hypothetical protein [Salinicola endophyticus]WFF40088.1 hypothetical protein EVC62_00510 [Salinicola endophyticus]